MHTLTFFNSQSYEEHTGKFFKVFLIQKSIKHQQQPKNRLRQKEFSIALNLSVSSENVP